MDNYMLHVLESVNRIIYLYAQTMGLRRSFTQLKISTLPMFCFRVAQRETNKRKRVDVLQERRETWLSADNEEK